VWGICFCGENWIKTFPFVCFGGVRNYWFVERAVFLLENRVSISMAFDGNSVICVIGDVTYFFFLMGLMSVFGGVLICC